MARMPRYPHVIVPLSDTDGNAGSILARVSRALGRAGVSPDEVKRYMVEAKSGGYDHLLQVTMEWVEVE